MSPPWIIHPGPTWRPRVVAASGLVAGFLIFSYATGAVRNVGGDVLVVLVLVAALASVPVGTARTRLAAVAVLSVGTEAFQSLGLVGPSSHWLLHLTVGSTFDPQDLVAYAAGLVVAAAAEWWWAPPTTVAAPPGPHAAPTDR